VRSELDQLLSLTAVNGVLVQESCRTTKCDSMYSQLYTELRRLEVVVSESSKFEIFIMLFCVVSYAANKTRAPYYIFICGLALSALSFTLFQIRQCFREK
jgi:hypothetical protein